MIRENESHIKHKTKQVTSLKKKLVHIILVKNK